MKKNFVHVCFIIDQSGSMYGSESDIIGGFKSVIEEQTKNQDITCAISLYKFDTTVIKEYVGKLVSEVNREIEYVPNGCTAMNDAIGQAITEIGQWLSGLPEEERPEKNLIVIMTDGEENSSREYTIEKVKDMITEQQDKYNWSFLYLGADITDAEYANHLNVGIRGFSGKNNYKGVFDTLNTCMCNYSVSCDSADPKAWDATISAAYAKITDDYQKEGNTVKNL